MVQESYDASTEKEPMSAAPAPVSEQSALKPEPPKSGRSIPVKWIIFGSIIIGIAVLLYFFRGSFIAATINGQPISRFAIVQELEQQMGAQVLDSLITKQLIRAKAAEAGITVREEEINQEINTIREQLSSQNTTLEDALADRGTTLSQLKEDITLQKFAERLVQGSITITEEEITDYMEANADFLPPADSEEETRAVVRDTLRQQKFSAAFQEWLLAARTDADISYWKEY